MRRVWLLTGLVAAVAVAAFAHGPFAFEPLAAPLAIPWPLLAVAVCVCELFAVNLHIRGETHAVSLGDIPIAFGLFFVAPAELVLAVLIGDLVALGVVKRQPPVKLAFNAASFVLQATLATIMFNALVDPANPIGPSGWAAAGIAVAGSGALGALLVQLAMTFSDGTFNFREFGWVLTFGTGVALINVALALIGIVAFWIEPIAGALLIAPALALVVAYRAYQRERRARQDGDALTSATRAVRDAPDAEAAMLALMDQARNMFRAGRAELVLLADGEMPEALRAGLRPDQPGARPRAVDPSGDPLWKISASLTGAKHLSARDSGETGAALRAEGIETAIAAPIIESGELRGGLLIADPLNEVEGFSGADLELVELLVAHGGAALELDRLSQSYAELTRLEQELSHRVLHDSLTGLANRTLFADRVAHALTRRSHALVAVLFVDLDDFKSVNDTRGHAVGDELLVSVADQIQSCLRPSDTAARLGGDEFGVLLEEIDGVSEAQRVAERIGETLWVSSHGRRVQASIGIAPGRAGDIDAGTLLRNADLAMYAAKGQGKGGSALFEPGMHENAARRFSFEVDLPTAIANDELVLEYQPIIALGSGGIYGHEALLRWRHPERGMLSPGEFLPAAESSGAMPDILTWTLGRALEDATRDHALGRAFVSVNVSSSQLEHADFLATLRSCLDATGADPGRLVLEVVETEFMSSLRLAAERLAAARTLGVRVAIDDFGTGHSSLEHLAQLPVDIIKLPMSLTRDIAWQPRSAELIKAVRAMCDALALEVVAEGVEGEQQATTLTSLGVPYGQGFLLGRPAELSGRPRLRLAG